jgi:hypothetical protein
MEEFHDYSHHLKAYMGESHDLGLCQGFPWRESQRRMSKAFFLSYLHCSDPERLVSLVGGFPKGNHVSKGWFYATLRS